MPDAARPELLAARRGRGWSQSEAARELAVLARASGEPRASPASLKSLLSRWENGHAVPDPAYRTLLAELYGRTAGELGLAPHPGGSPGAGDGAAARFLARVAAAAMVDERLLGAWSEQLCLARRLDDDVGAAGAAGLVRALVDELERVFVHAVDPATRADTGILLAGAATLAGWQELDLGDPGGAWLRFTRAREAAAAAAGSAEATANAAAEATAGLAAVLVDVGDPDSAIALLDVTTGPEPAGAQAWRSAARGAALAARGRHTEARSTFDAAEQTLTAGPGSGHAAPSGGIDAADVRRWRAQALAVVGGTATRTALEAALAAGVRSARERAVTHAALAALLARPGGAGAAEHARAARTLAERIGSARALALLDRATAARATAARAATDRAATPRAGPSGSEHRPGAQPPPTEPISSSAAR
ncbi:MAG: helix-turn-helix domain-containing protein [Pseudonocardia sp.]